MGKGCKGKSKNKNKGKEHKKGKDKVHKKGKEDPELQPCAESLSMEEDWVDWVEEPSDEELQPWANRKGKNQNKNKGKGKDKSHKTERKGKAASMTHRKGKGRDWRCSLSRR